MQYKNKYLKLFLSTLTISAVTFGGGYVIVSFLKKKFTDELGWIDEEEMLNLVAIAQSSPGAVAVNAAILVGYRIGGIPCVFLAVLGTIIPPFLIISAISFCYSLFKDNKAVAAVLLGLQSGIAAVIADVTVTLGSKASKESGAVGIAIMCTAFAANFFLGINVIWIILFSGIIGFLTFWMNNRGNRTSDLS